MNATNLSQRTRLAIMATALGLAFSAAAASANDLVPKTSVRWSDLNVASPTGAKTLYERIVRASYEICQHFDRDSHYNADPIGMQACRKQVIADTVVKIGRPTLYAVYNARNPTHLAAPIVTADSGK